MDIGGHRFFSKSDRIMQWWQEIMPHDFLVRNRKSRIFFSRAFFDYPITMSARLFYHLGLIRSIKIGVTYLWRLLFPLKNEKTLEQFYINRFGDELYATFFRDYTMKVWGRSCSLMSADWGAQRAKELSVLKALADSLKRLFLKRKTLEQKNTETSLITQFLYPKYGPGQLWELVAQKIIEMGGIIYTEHEVIDIMAHDNVVNGVRMRDRTGTVTTLTADCIISSMAIKDLIAAIDANIPTVLRELADQLPYRDFVTIGVLINKKLPLDDNWIYIQEPDIKMGRIQIFNNWSPFMVVDSCCTWLGLEYFCNEGDDFWTMADDALLRFATQELIKIGFVGETDVIDGVVVRVQKAYPAYWGAYDQFDVLKNFLNRYTNLFLIGRNGMHRYNNQDHSMLSAMAAVDLLSTQSGEKELIWQVNAEKEYHESKQA
jgi:protoporphyrinogen oxidase